MRVLCSQLCAYEWVIVTLFHSFPHKTWISALSHFSHSCYFCKLISEGNMSVLSHEDDGKCNRWAFLPFFPTSRDCGWLNMVILQKNNINIVKHSGIMTYKVFWLHVFTKVPTLLFALTLSISLVHNKVDANVISKQHTVAASA